MKRQLFRFITFTAGFLLCSDARAFDVESYLKKYEKWVASTTIGETALEQNVQLKRSSLARLRVAEWPTQTGVFVDVDIKALIDKCLGASTVSSGKMHGVQDARWQPTTNQSVAFRWAQFQTVEEAQQHFLSARGAPPNVEISPGECPDAVVLDSKNEKWPGHTHVLLRNIVIAIDVQQIIPTTNRPPILPDLSVTEGWFKTRPLAKQILDAIRKTPLRQGPPTKLLESKGALPPLIVGKENALSFQLLHDIKDYKLSMESANNSFGDQLTVRTNHVTFTLKPDSLGKTMVIIRAIGPLGQIVQNEFEFFVAPDPKIRKPSCSEHLKRLNDAKSQWALELQKSIGDVVPWNEIVGSIGYIRFKPVCPEGGTYSLNTFGLPPTCSIGTNRTPAHVLPK